MLTLMHRAGEITVCTLEDGRRIEIQIVAIESRAEGHVSRVRIGIDAPRTIIIDREEVDQRKQRERGEVNGNA